MTTHTPQRRAALLALTLLTALGLGQAYGRFVTSHPNAHGVAHAQSQEPILEVGILGSTLTFRTQPQVLVNAELSNAEGRKAEGLGVADNEGVAQVTFFQGNPSIEPGDTIALTRAGDQPLRVVVPNLRADVDPATDVVAGMAPPNAEIEIDIRSGDASLTRSVTAGPDGSFALLLAGELDILPGDATGSVGYTSDDNARYTVQFAALSADILSGSPAVRGSASPGTTVQLDVLSAGGETFTLGPTQVGGDASYTLFSFGESGIRPLGADDVVTVTQTSDILPGGVGNRILTGMIDAVSVSVDANGDRISGNGPASQVFVIRADDMDGTVYETSLTTMADGSFAYDFGGRVDLGPGWRVMAGYEVAPGLRVIGLSVLPKARVGVNLPITQGRGRPLQAMTATLYAANDQLKGRQQTFVDDQGEYLLFMGGIFGPGGAGEMPGPGDRLELEFADAIGDPTVLRIPDTFTAQSDVDSDAVVGEAPADASLRVVVTSDPSRPSASAVADSDGQYRADFAPGFDLVRPAGGEVYLEASGGNELWTTWAAVQINATIGNTIQPAFVNGNGPAWRNVKAELVTPEGQVAASAETTVFDGLFFGGAGVGGGGGGPQFFLPINDITGIPVEMQPGDTLRITSGDEVTEVEIPALDSIVLVQANRVNGRTAPDSPVTLRLGSSPLAFDIEEVGRSDASGNFFFDVTDKHTIRNGDFVQLTVGIGPHNVLDFLLAPGMLLDADQSILLGSLAPDLGLRITVKRGGRTLMDQPTGSDASGAFAALLLDGQGNRILLQPGDEIDVVPSDPTQDALSLTVPVLEIGWDEAADTVGGRATADGELILLATIAYARQATLGIAQAYPLLGAEGRYDADFVPSLDVRPGERFYGLYRPAEGHYVLRSRTVPILNAEHGGPNSCGFGTAHESVDVSLELGGTASGSLSTTARFDGYFSDVLVNAQDEIVRSAPGHTERATLGPGQDGRVSLPDLEVNANWAAGVITGTGPAGVPIFVAPAVPCAFQHQPNVLNISPPGGFEWFADEAGGFVFPPQVLEQIGGGTPGTGLEIAYYDADSGDRYFHQVYRALAQIFIGTDRVAGRSNALAEVDLSLWADGASTATAQGTASNNGFFNLSLTDGEGEPARIQAGNTVRLNGEDIEVEPLQFDWSAGAPVFGSAPPNRDVELALRLTSGQRLNIDLTSDADGDFSFTAADVPPRAAWSLDDVAAIRLTLYTELGHEIVDQTPGFEGGPGPNPGGDGRTIFLPAAFKNGGPGGALDIAAQPAAPASVVAPERLSPAQRVEAELADGLGLVERGSLYGGEAFLAGGMNAPAGHGVDVAAAARSVFAETGLGGVGNSAASLRRMHESSWQRLVVERQLELEAVGIAPEQRMIDAHSLPRPADAVSRQAR